MVTDNVQTPRRLTKPRTTTLDTTPDTAGVSQFHSFAWPEDRPIHCHTCGGLRPWKHTDKGLSKILATHSDAEARQPHGQQRPCRWGPHATAPGESRRNMQIGVAAGQHAMWHLQNSSTSKQVSPRLYDAHSRSPEQSRTDETLGHSPQLLLKPIVEVMLRKCHAQKVL